jgi:hypothetical protein
MATDDIAERHSGKRMDTLDKIDGILGRLLDSGHGSLITSNFLPYCDARLNFSREA